MATQTPEDPDDKRRRVENKIKLVLAALSTAAALSRTLKDWLS
jgi:hypothetical protein